MSVVLFIFTNTTSSFSDTHTSQFKPHPSSGKYSAIACRSSGNNAPIQFSGNSATGARTFLSPTEIFGGNLRSNADIKITGNGYINGDATPAPGHIVNKTGNGTVTGSVHPADTLLDCSMANLTQMISWVKQNNDDSSIPTTNQGRMPWGCGSNPPPNDPWQFCLKGNETIHLSGGTYWFSSWSQSGNSKIIIDGYVRILVTGSIGLSGNLSINADGDPYNLLIFAIPDSSFSLQMSGNTIFSGLMYGPAITAQLSGQSIINGSLISQELNASGQAKLKRWIDQTTPQITFIAPTATCLNSQNVNVSITITDNESGIDPENINLRLDGNSVDISINPADSFLHSVNVAASLAQIPGGSHILTAAVYDRAGNSNQVSQTIIVDTIPPVLGITFPANGATLQTTNILVTGNVEDDFSDQCGLSLRVNDAPVVIQSDGSWYAAITLAASGDPQPITAVATDGAGNTKTVQIFVTYSTFMPSLPPNIKPGLLQVDVHKYCDTCSNGNGIFEPEETVIVEPSWEFTGGTPQGFTNHVGSWSGPQDGTQYIIVRDKADYAVAPGTTTAHCDPNSDCYILALDPDQSPHRDAWLTENFSNGSFYTWTVHLGKSFTDIPVDSPFYRDVETMLHHGLTSGCGGLQFCPDASLTRWQIAIFLARAIAGGDEKIPNSGIVSIPNEGVVRSYNCSSTSPSSLFADIQPTDFHCRYVHYLFRYGVTAGCSTSPRNFCPNSSVSRSELAILAARALTYSDSAIPSTYADPQSGQIIYDCSQGIQPYNNDVPAGNPLCKYVNYLWAQGAANYCGTNAFCPTAIANRAQTADILIKAFGIDLYMPLSPHSSRPARVAPCKWGKTHLSWGGYDLLSDKTNTNICGNIREPMEDMAECFRVFVNYCESPTECVFTYPTDNMGGYDLTKWDPEYWENRVQKLMDCSGCGNGIYKKAVFTIGHGYQCTHDGSFSGPWCKNSNHYSDFMDPSHPDTYCDLLTQDCSTGEIKISGNWMDPQWDPSSCKAKWIKCEYWRLINKLKAKSADVFEIFNEAHPTDNDINAHKDIIDYLRSKDSTLKFQISIDPNNPYDWNAFQYAWGNLINYPSVYYWAIHGLLPDQIKRDPNNHNNDIPPWWTRDDINADLEKKLEISTDGQLCIQEFNPDSNPNHCVHYLAAGAFLNAFRDQDDLHFESDSVPLQWWSRPQMNLIKNTCNGSDPSGKLFISNAWNAAFVNSDLNVCAGDSIFAFWDTSSKDQNHPNSCTIETNPPGWTDTGLSGYNLTINQWVISSEVKTLKLKCDNIQLDSLNIIGSSCSSDIDADNCRGDNCTVNQNDKYWIHWRTGGCINSSSCTVYKKIDQGNWAVWTDCSEYNQPQGSCKEWAEELHTISYKIDCTCKAGGSSSKTVTVTIIPPPPEVHIFANGTPDYYEVKLTHPLTPYTISWWSLNSASCIIRKNDVNWTACPDYGKTSGSCDDSSATDTDYYVQCPSINQQHNPQPAYADVLVAIIGGPPCSPCSNCYGSCYKCICGECRPICP